MTRQGFLLLGIGVACFCLGLNQARFLALFLQWIGVNFVAVSAAYFFGWHRIFGKRSDGSLPAWSWLVFWPYHLVSVLVWRLYVLVSSEPPFHVISDHLIVGRRLRGNEQAPPVQVWVDLTTEFQEPSAHRAASGYRNFAILDAGIPDEHRLHEWVASTKGQKTFVHCAQGHSRTGLFAVAILLMNGDASSVEDGLRRLKSIRPGINLNHCQRQLIDRYFHTYYAGGPRS